MPNQIPYFVPLTVYYTARLLAQRTNPPPPPPFMPFPCPAAACRTVPLLVTTTERAGRGCTGESVISTRMRRDSDELLVDDDAQADGKSIIPNSLQPPKTQRPCWLWVLLLCPASDTRPGLRGFVALLFFFFSCFSLFGLSDPAPPSKRAKSFWSATGNMARGCPSTRPG